MTQGRQASIHQTTRFQGPSLRGSMRSHSQGHRSEAQSSPREYPSHASAALGPPPFGTLHKVDGSAFNVDPTAPYLDSGALEAARAQEQVIPPASRSNRNFVGGFVSGLKRAMWSKQRHREQSDAPAPPTVYASPEYRYRNMAPASMTPPPMSITPISPLLPTQVHHPTATSQNSPPPLTQSQSPPSSSGTTHETGP
ncbi:hypothetical protein BDZ94DRAFT_1255380 [Collybia nuda]|uniref:Uncharacterized protein n=1 Tax=Collybia nuda TaxID=64659 RepID=A0A9P5YAJ7_9AGAR|nr:hypothetical protein BDZ94DRAFT_1255380 [Collybia nuda]